MPIGESLDITLPTVSTTVGPAWATSLNAALTTIITAVETPVTPDGLNINADLEFNDNEALEVGALGLENKSASFGGAGNIVKLYVYDGELYYNDADGTAVQITANGNLNAAALAGIGGDYGGADPAALNFTASTSTFVFLENTAGALRALIDSGQHLLRATAGAGYAIKLTAPAGLTGDVDRTFLSANPAATALLQVSTAGVESTTLSPSLTGATITESGIRHGNLTLTQPAFDGLFLPATSPAAVSVSVAGLVTVVTGANVMLPVRVPVGSRIISARVELEDNSLSLVTVTLLADGATLGTANSAGDGSVQTIGPTGLTTTVTAGVNYCILVSSLDTNDVLDNVQIVIDRVV